MPATITDRLNGLTTSVAVKPPCVAVATSNIALSALQTVGGVALAQDDRVLVIGQTDTTENGIYIADSGNWTRAPDFDGARDAVQGTLILINTMGGPSIYELTSANPVTFGTSAITFAQVYGANSRYDITAAEVAAAAVPTDLSIPSHAAIGYVIVERYGAVITSATFNTAVAVALAAGSIPVQLTASFTATTQLVTGANVLVKGGGRRTTIITKGFNGDLFASFKSGAGMLDLGLDGNGANFTGRLLPITGSDGKQHAVRCDFTNSESFCIDFETNAGSQSFFGDCRIARYLGTTSDAFCSVRIAAAQQLSAKPRLFFGCQSDGTYFIDFGGSNNTEVVGGFAGGFKFSDESRAIKMSSMRWGNQPTCTVRGHQVTIVGCDINPDLTLEGSGPILIDSTLNGTIVDNCTAGSSSIISPSESFTPTWTAVSADPAIGNGTLRGEVVRMGNSLKISYELIIGSTTTLGTGGWRFSVPKAPALTSGTVQVGMGVAVGASYVLLAARLLNAGTYIELFVPGGLTQVGPAAPFAWAAGNSLRIEMTYAL